MNQKDYDNLCEHGPGSPDRCGHPDCTGARWCRPEPERPANPCSCCDGKGFHGLFSAMSGRWCEQCRGTGRNEVCVQEAEPDRRLIAVLHAAQLLLAYEHGPRDAQYVNGIEGAWEILSNAVEAANAHIAGS